MRVKFLTLSAAASVVLTAATPMVSTSMSTDNGGTKSAIDAYSDGGGVVIINQAGDTKFDNSAMNSLVFKYGETAKSSNTTLKNQVSVLSTDTSAAEKANAVKFDLAKVVVNPPVNGTSCDDGNPQTVTDVWNNGLCGGNNIENQNCDDNVIQTINDKYHNGVCGGTNVEGVVCNDNVAQTINDVYHNGVCSGINVEGQACDDGVQKTYNDKYVSGACIGTVATSCKDIKTLYSLATNGSYVIDPDGAGAAAQMTVSCDMTTSGGGWTKITPSLASMAGASWDANGLISGTNKPQNCGLFTASNFNIFNIGLEFSEIRVDFSRTSTIMQCASIGVNAASLNSTTSSKLVQSGVESDKSTCTWGDNVWAYANGNSSTAGLPLNWRLYGSKYSTYNQFDFTSRCAYSNDTGAYSATSYIR